MPLNTDLFRRLCETPGVPGREERVRDLIRSEIKGLFDSTKVDSLGSLICTRNPTRQSRTKKKPTRVMLAAHMDEIGFYVRHIDEKGFLWVNPAGGFDPRNLFSRRVLVCTDKGDHLGVMNPGGRPVHIATPEDRKKVPALNEFFIDLGMSPAKAKKQVKIGDFVVMHEPFEEQPEALVSKALDNRLACYVAIEAIRKIKRTRSNSMGRHTCEIVVAFTTQEEVGLRGALVAANQVKADIGLGLDVTLCCDTPGIPDDQRVTKRGDGAAILIQDSSMIANHELVDEICAVARRRRIKHQRSILPLGGQDGAAIQRSGSGARCATISTGTRYIHTVTESLHKGDLQATVDLVAAWLATQD
jgi:endoglucanase